MKCYQKHKSNGNDIYDNLALYPNGWNLDLVLGSWTL